MRLSLGIYFLMLFLPTIGCYSQDILEHEKYYPLLGRTKKEIVKTLPTEFGVWEATQSKTNKDSIRLVFFVKERDTRYTLFIFGGKCTYIGVTNYKRTNQEFLNELRKHTRTYAEPFSEDELDYYITINFSPETLRAVGFFNFIPGQLELMVVEDTDEPKSASTFYVTSVYESDVWHIKTKK